MSITFDGFDEAVQPSLAIRIATTRYASALPNDNVNGETAPTDVKSTT